MSEKPKSLKSIRANAWNRSLSLTKVAVVSTMKYASSKLTASGSTDAAAKALLITQAQMLVKELSKLKGSMMKVGQMLGMYGEHFFPEEVTSILKTLNDSSSQLAWEQIEKSLRKELGEALDAFEVEHEAFAAASLGQVHKARHKDQPDEILCFKIQYPGVAKAIDSDVATLRSLLSMTKLMPRSKKRFEAMMQEIKTMLKRETDFVKEADAMDWMSERLADDDRYLIPKSYRDHSTKRLLVTRFTEGTRLDSPDVLRLPMERRVKLAEAYLDLFLKELFEWRWMQTDPHFGNYRIRLREHEPDQLILFDFGAMRKFSKKFIRNYQSLLNGAVARDEDLVVAAGLALGFLREDDSPKMLSSFCEIACMAVEPWMDVNDPLVPKELYDARGQYLWDKSDLPNRMTNLAAKYALSFKLRPPPREVIFLDRKIAGVFLTLKMWQVALTPSDLMAKHLSSEGGSALESDEDIVDEVQNPPDDQDG